MIKTEAIILDSADLGETDRLLTTYTQQLGKVRVLAKGVKKLQSKLRSHIEPLSYVSLILVEGKNCLILKDAVLLDQFLSIRKDLKKTKYAWKVVEIIEQLIVGEEQDEDIWKLLLITFDNLNIKELDSKLIPNFRNNLLKLLGYDPREVKNLADIY